MILGFAAALVDVHLRSGRAAKRSLPRNPGLYKFLLNKWYFDELYDRIFVKPALLARPRAVEGL